MVQVVELSSQGTLKLPPDIAQRFHAADRFVLWAEGDTLHLKRLSAPPVTDIVAAAPPAEPMAPDELNDLIHALRGPRPAQ